MPWDHDDDVSRTLLEALIGLDGTPIPADYESISESLPEDWVSDLVGESNNMIYINIEEGWKSTLRAPC